MSLVGEGEDIIDRAEVIRAGGRGCWRRLRTHRGALFVEGEV